MMVEYIALAVPTVAIPATDMTDTLPAAGKLAVDPRTCRERQDAAITEVRDCAALALSAVTLLIEHLEELDKRVTKLEAIQP